MPESTCNPCKPGLGQGRYVLKLIYRPYNPGLGQGDLKPALALRAQISLPSVYDATCPDQPIMNINQVWARVN